MNSAITTIKFKRTGDHTAVLKAAEMALEEARNSSFPREFRAVWHDIVETLVISDVKFSENELAIALARLYDRGALSDILAAVHVD